MRQRSYPKKKIFRVGIIIVIIISGLFIGGCLQDQIQGNLCEEDELSIIYEFPTEEEIFLKKMNQREKIGQLFIIGFEGITLTSELKDLLKTVRPGGVILFSRNIQDEAQLKKLIKDIKKFSKKYIKLPLFITVDQEGGLVRRVEWIDDAISQAEIKDGVQASQVGLKRGRALMEIGFNLNLAPVLDITSEGDFLHNRSFQRGLKETGELAQALVHAQQEEGIFCTIKHFPGYGGIPFNPEMTEIPILSEVPEISQYNIVTLDTDPEFVMTSNVVYSEIDEDLPFTLSPEGIDFLRREVKGDYLVISDDLSTKAMKGEFSLRDSAILANKVGIDVLLVADWSQRKDALLAFNSLFGAVKSGKIQKDNIDKTVLKIIRMKNNIF